jgi:hypothetical protein
MTRILKALSLTGLASVYLMQLGVCEISTTSRGANGLSLIPTLPSLRAILQQLGIIQ